MFKELLTEIKARLEADDTVKNFSVYTHDEANFDDKFRASIRSDGIAVGVASLMGRPLDPDSTVIQLKHEIVVIVVENPETNSTEESGLSIVEAIISALHQFKIPTEKGLRNTITVDDPAYEIGELDVGPVSYFVNFRYKTAS